MAAKRGRFADVDKLLAVGTNVCCQNPSRVRPTPSIGVCVHVNIQLGLDSSI